MQFSFIIGFRFVSILFITHWKTNWKMLQLSCASNTSSRWETGTWQYNVQGKTFTGHSINSFFRREIKSSQPIFDSKILRAASRFFFFCSFSSAPTTKLNTSSCLRGYSITYKKQHTLPKNTNSFLQLTSSYVLAKGKCRVYSQTKRCSINTNPFSSVRIF